MSKSTRRMNKVLELIKTKPQRLTDLVEAAKMFTGGLVMKHNQEVLRILEDLEYLNLICKDEEGRYVFSYNVQTYDSYDHWRFLLDHSEKLLEGKKRVDFDLGGGMMKLLEQAMKATIDGHTKINLEDAKRFGVDAYSDEKFRPGKTDDSMGRMFIEHLETGYPETYADLKYFYDSWDTTRRYLDDLSNAVKEVLPDSKEYSTIKISGRPAGLQVGPTGDFRDWKLKVSSEIVYELKSLLRYKPSLIEVPYKVGLFDLKIGTLSLNMSKGLSNNVIKSLPSFKPLFIVIKEWNEYEDLVENKRGVIINAFSEIEASVRVGRPLKGVCSGCRDIVVKGDEV